jgi:hypothetical protein
MQATLVKWLVVCSTQVLQIRTSAPLRVPVPFDFWGQVMVDGGSTLTGECNVSHNA